MNSCYSNLYDSLMSRQWLSLGGIMGFVTDILGSVNWEALVQLAMIAAIMISGPNRYFLAGCTGWRSIAVKDFYEYERVARSLM